MTITRNVNPSSQGRALSDPSAYAAILPRIEAIAREAGAIAMDYFRHGGPTHAEVSHKACGSPVTEADLRIDHFLRESLSALAPEAGWLSEETADSPERLRREMVFVVDPIDGTRGFASGDPCFAICIALVAGGRPVVGVAHAPALDETFTAILGGGARRNGVPINVSGRPAIAGASVSAPEPLAADLRRAGLAFERKPQLPSLAMRLLRVADGEFDAALSRANAYDWDIAAADLILREAGGALTDFAGRAPLYNQVEPKHPALAAGPPGLQADLIRAARDGAAKAARERAAMPLKGDCQ
ncbi:3'(2'),5'-bisphosphate nucleotidase CysQ [Rhodoblastus acidophilus]|uniref:3'(2'),5'-bisphosphate nucleotidase CysQ n=1 Tax=Candidatus Rhodoblastus alkanivorans TaxID=2954117 RepID=A0ABS9Z5B4_9HYPH|nr:3'(2'),5'-bisphosphate nucleotidase CysQ [Candidatus Rhodoblastus alkanivorans]MCI4677688.1 3'(2'),5'-bisphosphate nucleotidase CysQ [Candidatus Rhodoblastus alkanivorans]MCI4682580.1 3'(2'),5'-bisphosphate nucleotidase CysQ [Candidatus Rhodoblastus alkanivorans]MDI4639886.1 3'(2'),5'-bisphosphate nucleotidase CysQ [Rhodoblastus acidophilus]